MKPEADSWQAQRNKEMLQGRSPERVRAFTIWDEENRKIGVKVWMEAGDLVYTFLKRPGSDERFDEKVTKRFKFNSQN